jgi:shikimate dehydrogenase
MHLALLGQGIGNSLSPVLQRAAAQSIGRMLQYTLLDLGDHELDETLEKIRRGHWDGVNITSPYKRWAWAQVSDHDSTSRRLEVVNTITPLGSGRLRGDNTDRVGFEHLLGDLPRRRPLILGAGGVARVVVHSLGSHDVDEMWICNRRLQRAADLQAFAKRDLQVIALNAVADHLSTVDLVVNCLPPSMSPWL